LTDTADADDPSVLVTGLAVTMSGKELQLANDLTLLIVFISSRAYVHAVDASAAVAEDFDVYSAATRAAFSVEMSA
jgi:hypothetical protein